jgi:hypothetical protein
MKIRMVKKGMTRYCQPEQLEQFRACGWADEQLDLFNSQAEQQKAVDEVIRLKPPVKNKATAQRALEEAKLKIEGDE